MKITFEPAAREELEGIFEWIKKDNARAAYEMVTRIEAKIARLATPALKHMGRAGRDTGTRELIEYPYIIVYEIHVDRGEIVVLAVVHGAQDRE